MAKVVRFPDMDDEIIHVRFYVRGDPESYRYPRSRRVTLTFFMHQDEPVNLSISGRKPLGPELARALWDALQDAPLTQKSRPILGAWTHCLPDEG